MQGWPLPYHICCLGLKASASENLAASLSRGAFFKGSRDLVWIQHLKAWTYYGGHLWASFKRRTSTVITLLSIVWDCFRVCLIPLWIHRSRSTMPCPIFMYVFGHSTGVHVCISISYTHGLSSPWLPAGKNPFAWLLPLGRRAPVSTPGTAQQQWNEIRWRWQDIKQHKTPTPEGCPKKITQKNNFSEISTWKKYLKNFGVGRWVSEFPFFGESSTLEPAVGFSKCHGLLWGCWLWCHLRAKSCARRSALGVGKLWKTQETFWNQQLFEDVGILLENVTDLLSVSFSRIYYRGDSKV